MNVNNNAGSKSSAKQVMYVDVDDEITTIIDKMNASDAKVVALVLPKRATVFQSIVNMKLLKRRAESAKKHIVLITSEAGLMPLAGLAGVHVASTLQSKPEIPEAGASHNDEDDEEAASLNDDFDPSANGAAPVGSLAGGAAGVSDEDVIELDNTSKGPVVSGPAAAAAPGKPKKLPKDRKLKIPDFFRFRKRLLFGGMALVLLIVGWYFAYFVMPKATVTIVTDSSDIEARLVMTLDTAANQVDESKLVVPAQTKQEQKSSTGQAPATGQENKGEKATGSVTMTNCSADGKSVTVPAGTGVSAKGLTYITQKSATLKTSTPGCKSFDGFTSETVNVVAQKGGANYNTEATDFTVAGISEVKASSSATFTGGTDNNVKVVQQSDVDSAKQKLSTSQDQTAIKRQLEQRLEDDGLYALTATFNAGTPNDNLSSKVGDEAESVTVTESVTYTMFGVKKSDLEKLIESDLEKKINKSQQAILDNGLSKARITVGTPGAGPQLKLDTFVTATAGPKIDTDELKKDIVGLKSGVVKDRIKQIQDVEDVQVKYSPFWVTKAPKAEKITIQFQKSSAGDNSDGN
jgi:hypothetical protein